jgi:uncharacterized membrane protein YeaQ/YmgE (transglycosylase-associated protein family)
MKALVIPVLVALLIYLITVAIAGYVGNQFDNHDTGMLVAVLLGLVGGLGAGMAGVLTWLVRNR